MRDLRRDMDLRKEDVSKFFYYDLFYYPNNKRTIRAVYEFFKSEKQFKKFWNGLINVPGISYRVGKQTLYQEDKLYDFFYTNGFSANFERHRLKTWEDVIGYKEDYRYYKCIGNNSYQNNY